MPGEDAAQAARVGDDGAGEAGALLEVGEPDGGLGSRGAAEFVQVVGGQGEEVLPALEGLFGFDLGPKP
ncbi:hypothetical protein OHA19_39920 (plasmid) [Streptomyces sp. NBC_00012]|uniref:hypothetical protein n=1 Tax=Streptomyces sp. NBC_00012 TaxID=2975621 RepID=UPI0032498E7B